METSSTNPGFYPLPSGGFLLVVLILAVAITAFHVRTAAIAPAPADETVMLPVLVYPDDGHSTHVEQVTVHSSDVSGVDSLYFQMHQPFYHLGGVEIDEQDGFDTEGAASIRINGGAWIDIRNENVQCASPEEEHGCIGGTSNTIRFTLPATASGDLQNGATTIEFRFNGTDGIRSGYRVLGIGFMESGDPHVEDFDAYSGDSNGDGLLDGAIDQTEWTHDDPSAWAAPSDGDASNGATLWSQRDILEDGNGEPITASCASCHFSNGADLKYFGYSNRTIAARSKFHGLTSQQGKDIAAYIRSLNLQTEDGTPYEAPGRPWQPPFQPGPEMLGSNESPDRGDAAYWMAGAGLRWVLDEEREVPDTERDMLAHIFPKNGDPSQGVDYIESGPYAGDLRWNHIHLDSTINVRRIPLSRQFPDWNNWLPDVHPLDFQPNMESSDVWSFFKGEFEDRLDNDDAGDAGWAIRSLRDRTRDMGWPKGINGSNMIGSPSDNEIALARLSSQQWFAVEAAGALFDNHLFENPGQEYCDYQDEWYHSWCEERSWPSGARSLFQLGPHVNGTLEGNPEYGYGDRPRSADMTHIWYHVQLIVNPGSRHPGGITPVDWNYQQAFITGSEQNPLRILTSSILKWQLVSNKLGNDPETTLELTSSWNPGGFRWTFFLSETSAEWRGLSHETSGKVFEAALRSWWNETRKYDPSTFPRDPQDEPRSFDNAEAEIKPATYVPPFESQTRYYQAWRVMADEHGEELAGVLDSLTTWAGTMWPKGNDSSLMGDHPTWEELIDYSPPSATTQSISLNPGWNLVSSRFAPESPSLDSLFSDMDDVLVIVQNQAGDDYDPDRETNDLDTWNENHGYRVYVTDERTLAIDGTELESPTQELSEGWNLLPYYPSRAMSVADAFSSLGDALEAVKDEEGNSYVPERDVDEIGTLEPGRAYKVYVSSATSFTYPE